MNGRQSDVRLLYRYSYTQCCLRVACFCGRSGDRRRFIDTIGGTIRTKSECLSVDGTRYLGDHKIAYSSYIQYRENKNEYTVARTSGYELILNLIV